MKEVLREVSQETPFGLEEIDIDRSADLEEKFGQEVPVLFIDGRKAFKYRVTAGELKDRLRKAV